MIYHLAIDIGASSGRHILGHLEDGKMVLEEVYRFDNSQIRKDGHDCWDHQALARSVLQGIAKCKEIGKIPATIGIDTWGVDFILLDEQGLTCSDMVAYRDARTPQSPPTSSMPAAASRRCSSTPSTNSPRSRRSIPSRLRRRSAS